MPDLGLDLASGAPGRAEQRALRVAQEAAAQVPAYARFLRLAGYEPARLRTIDDFRQLPITDKASYLARYPLPQRCRRGDLTRAHIVTLSSGSAGPATLWPRYPEQEGPLLAAVSGVLQEHFRVRQRWTLVVLAQAIGAWGFATSMKLVCQRLFAQPDVRGTVVSPGLNGDDVLGFVEQLGPEYDQTLLVSYPAILPPLLAAGARRGLDWRRLNTCVLASGQALSEPQREEILGYLGRDPERLEGCVAVFGASEVAGMLGYESVLCLLLRRLCVRRPELCEALFGSPQLPSLHQYNPLASYLEVHDGELLLTIRGAVPLVRYNTHDRGGLLSFEELVARCRAQGIDLAAELRARGHDPRSVRPLPFMYAFGRSDAVIVSGGNVYRDEVAGALDQPPLRATATGLFDLAAHQDAAGHTTLHVTAELRPGVVPTAELRAQYAQGIREWLRHVNSIFRTVYEASDGRIQVAAELVPYGALAARGPKQARLELSEPAAAPAATDRDGAPDWSGPLG
jgi:phenylacetate-CoA ligase